MSTAGFSFAKGGLDAEILRGKIWQLGLPFWLPQNRVVAEMAAGIFTCNRAKALAQDGLAPHRGAVVAAIRAGRLYIVAKEAFAGHRHRHISLPLCCAQYTILQPNSTSKTQPRYIEIGAPGRNSFLAEHFIL